jgi:hypothetical protein
MGLDRDEPPREMRRFLRSKERFKDVPKADRAALTGSVPSDVSYDTWLRRQPASFQDDVMGVKKGRLFRKGELKMDRFIDQGTQREYTLDELRRREPEAFRKAGLDES